ncbi:SIMPL domain-containing protein [Parvibaculum sp.]|uniref:SIMPL domain-containing protein n=1 Tax=Parvibaculum sp. TaxID=2024848 RepID=UPI00320F758F
MPARMPLNRFAAALAGAIALGALMGAAGPAGAEEAPRRALTVTGTGEITTHPDIATVETGVLTEGKTAADALAANTKAMNEVFKGLEAMKIARDDIRTSEFSVSPVYSQPPTRPDGAIEAPVIRGYQVRNQVTVTVRKLAELGATLDKLVSLGSNQLGGISFGIDKPEPLLDEARADAVKDALRKAKIYAGAAGVTLGKIVTISESGGYAPQPVFAMKAMAMRDSAPVPVAAGTQKITSDVSLVIEIE